MLGSPRTKSNRHSCARSSAKIGAGVQCSPPSRMRKNDPEFLLWQLNREGSSGARLNSLARAAAALSTATTWCPQTSGLKCALVSIYAGNLLSLLTQLKQMKVLKLR